MIQAIWIITDTGQCIFSHKYVTLDIDDQLISGLLLAFDAFSNESGIGGVQQIGGEDNQFVYGSSGKLLVAALADKRDNPELVERLMVKISKNFQEKYKPYLSDISFVDLNVFNGFEKEIDNVLLKKVYNRGISSTIFGTFVALAITAGVFLLIYENILGGAIFLVFLIFVPGMLIGSLIAGKITYGLIVSSSTVTPIIGYYIREIIIDYLPQIEAATVLLKRELILSMVSNIMLMAITYITIALLCGILGGGVIDRKRLFPLIEAKGANQIIPTNGEVSHPKINEQTFYQEQAYPQETTQDEFIFTEDTNLQQENHNDWEQ
ncbi:MAG: hypothetical protein JXA54_13570 [Candidatus Heimdallarchaeota archaeon]|nr:hypothetical protein [Candidatus Heimdallarchaeota archaeon]